MSKLSNTYDEVEYARRCKECGKVFGVKGRLNWKSTCPFCGGEQDVEVPNIAKEKMLLEELQNMWAEFPYGKRVHYSHDFNKYTSSCRYRIKIIEKAESNKDVYWAYEWLKDGLKKLREHVELSSSRIVIQWSDYRYDLRTVEVVEQTEEYTIFKDLSYKDDGEKKFMNDEIRCGEGD